MSTGGWIGTVLRINLTTGQITKEPLNMEWAEDFIGPVPMSLQAPGLWS